MASIDIATFSAAQIRDGIIAGDFSAREVAEASIAQMERIEPDVHAFIQQTPELALAAARVSLSLSSFPFSSFLS